MFSDRIVTFRGDDTVEREANLVRRWGGFARNTQFNIVDLIEGPLRTNLNFKVDIIFSDSRLDSVPAFVTFSRNKELANLYVRRSVWNLADAGHDISRFILAHETGHLKMHRHDALGFSDVSNSILSKMPEEDRAEPQADKFADRLLVEESLIVGFNCADEVAYIFNVPIHCAQRRLDHVKDKARRRASRQVGEACPECANFTLVRDGTCVKCDTCRTIVFKHGIRALTHSR